MDFQQVHSDELSSLLEEDSPFRYRYPKKEDVETYLKNTNGFLVTKEVNDKTRKSYLITASIYVFANPILHLGVNETYKSSFCRILRKEPFNLKDPLTILFNKSGSEEEPQVSFQSNPLVRFEENTLKEGEFKRSDRFKRNLITGLEKISAKLHHEYSESAHLEFVGIYDVCLPLFGIKRKNPRNLVTSEMLKEERGSFYLQIPSFLTP